MRNERLSMGFLLMMLSAPAFAQEAPGAEKAAPGTHAELITPPAAPRSSGDHAWTAYEDREQAASERADATGPVLLGVGGALLLGGIATGAIGTASHIGESGLGQMAALPYLAGGGLMALGGIGLMIAGGVASSSSDEGETGASALRLQVGAGNATLSGTF